MTTNNKTKNNQFSEFLRVEVAKVTSKSDAVANQCEVIAVAQGKDKPTLKKGFEDYSELVAGLAESDELSANAGSGCLVRFAGARGSIHTLFIGLGKEKPGIDVIGSLERIRRLGGAVVNKLNADKMKSADVYLDSFLNRDAGLGNVDAADAAYAFVEGMGLAAYKFDKYISKKDEKKNKEVLSVALVTKESAQATKFEKGIEKARAHVIGASLCRDLSNEPSNALYPGVYADIAHDVAKKYGLKFTVLDEKAMKKEGMGLLLGVGQGSVNPPRLVVLEYSPAKAKKSIAFVGKGVTFDSGGISIKPSAKMEEMKHDMSGSAAVIGAIVTCALLKVPAKVYCVMALAENMPDGNAIQPGNILKGRNGKTVEVTNTDAEGRLVLADALDYIQDKKPDYVIDLATLTGAIGIALGKSCAGLMTNHDGFAKQVKAAASATGERVWELPLFEEYFEDLKSEYADMRNSGDTPYHGSAKGAMFIKEFIRKDTKWVHLDIAYTANAVGGISYYSKRSATGYGVRLLVNLAANLK